MAHVMKFGGSCLGDPAGLDHIADRLRECGSPVIVVLSALQGVTEKLLAACEAAREGGVDSGPVAGVHRVFLELVEGSEREEARRDVDGLLAELDKLLTGIAYLAEVSPRTRDRLLSLGERLSVALVSACLRGRGLDAVAVLPGDMGLRSDGHFGNACILDDAAAPVRAALEGLPLAVVPGFYGRDAAGEINTLGRGGSDYTATWLAAALGRSCTLWKDVGGFRTADPKMVRGSRNLPKLDYLDALELAHYGSTVIHDKALAPAMRAKVPVEIRGFEDPSQRTIISPLPSRLLAVAALPHAAVVDIHGFEANMMSSLASLLTAMADVRVAPLLLTEASPRGETSIVLKSSDLEALQPHLARLDSKVVVDVRRDLGVVSVIGSGMTGRVGFAADVFQTLAAGEINILAIAQTVSERNVSVIVDADSVVPAVRSLHRRFIEGDSRAAGAGR